MKVGEVCVDGVTRTNSTPTHTMKSILVPLFLSLAMTATVFAAWPINDECPVDHKASRPIYRVKTDEGFVSFCCTECMQKFAKSPGSYPVKKKEVAK